MSLSRLILENKSDNRFEKLILILKQNDFKPNDDYFKKVGQGVESTVYASNKFENLVVRIQNYVTETDMHNWYKVHKSKKNLDNVVKVHYVYINEIDDISVVIMEKLSNIPKDIERMYNNIIFNTKKSFAYDFLDFITLFYKAYIDDNNFDIFYKKWFYDEDYTYDSETKLKLLKKYMPHLKDLIADLFNGAMELKRLKIKHLDAHGGNIMYDEKTGKYKLIDL